jgi:uncharacterized repeat protein (TIGR02543 family)
MAATSNNGIGVTGLVFDRELYGAAMFGVSQEFDWNVALDDLVGSGASVINVSIGLSDDVQLSQSNDPSLFHQYYQLFRSRFEQQLLGYLEKGRDFVIVQAAGNLSNNAGYDTGWFDAMYSGFFLSLDHPELRSRVIAVASIDNTSRLVGGTRYYDISRFSQVGARVDIAAPGSEIYSLIPNDQMLAMSGTSMAAPHVAGAAALVWAANPGLSGPEVKEILTGSYKHIATNRNSGGINEYPVLNAREAVVAARNKIVPSPRAITLTGTVYDFRTGEPIPGATVVVSYAGGGLVSTVEITCDDNGAYSAVIDHDAFVGAGRRIDVAAAKEFYHSQQVSVSSILRRIPVESATDAGFADIARDFYLDRGMANVFMTVRGVGPNGTVDAQPFSPGGFSAEIFDSRGNRVAGSAEGWNLSQSAASASRALELPAGAYTMRTRAEGYNPLEQEFVVTAHSMIMFTINSGYTVSYDLNGAPGHPPEPSIGVMLGASVTLPTAPPREGYSFDGWYTEAVGGTRVGGAQGTYAPVASITLYARWSRHDPGDGGYAPPPPQPVYVAEYRYKSSPGYPWISVKKYTSLDDAIDDAEADVGLYVEINVILLTSCTIGTTVVPSGVQLEIPSGITLTIAASSTLTSQDIIVGGAIVGAAGSSIINNGTIVTVTSNFYDTLDDPITPGLVGTGTYDWDDVLGGWKEQSP